MNRGRSEKEESPQGPDRDHEPDGSAPGRAPEGMGPEGREGEVGAEGIDALSYEADETWTEPRSPGIPEPTYWPAAVALSVVTFSLGFLTSWAITAAGLAAFTFSVTRWMEELNRDA